MYTASGADGDGFLSARANAANCIAAIADAMINDQVRFILKFSRSPVVQLSHELLQVGQRFQVPSAKNLFELAQQFPMHQSIRSQSLATVQLEWPTLKVGHRPSGLLHDQYTRRRVPRVEVELPKSVKTSTRYAAKVQRRRARSPHSMRVQRDLMVKEDIRVLVALMAGKSRSQQALGQTGGL